MSSCVPTRPAQPRRSWTPRVIGATTLALAALACALPALPALAEVVTTANVSAELLSENLSIRSGETFTVGIALRPAKDWHTYWINPGDSGLPTRVEWKLPAGFRAGELAWPHPVRLGEAPFVTYGYEADSLLLADIEAPTDLRPGQSADLAASVRWLACREDACIPGKAELPLSLRVESSAPKADPSRRQLFEAKRAEVPVSLAGWTATFERRGPALRIDVSAPSSERPAAAGIQVFPVLPGVLNESAEVSVRAADGGFTIEAVADEKAALLPESLALVLIADKSWDEAGKVRALRVDAKRGGSPGEAGLEPRAAAPAPTSAAEQTGSEPTGARPGDDLTFWAAIALALLGGLALNLMPCVFPVLSLKVLGFLHVAHHDAAVARRHGYAFTAGVVVSFWLLAGVLLALRAAGGFLGWGFQLQEPLFVAAIAVLLFAMALNLLGVFELGTSVTGAVGRFDSRSGYQGSFLSGVLATILATPCSAPFMGTAIGFALGQSTAVSFAVFTSLGVGMAAPYLLLACAPVLLARLPRPGAWMETFREAMAFPLLATVAWLVWVFGQQTGNDGVLGLLLALLSAAVGAWIAGRFPSGKTAALLSSACMAGAVYLAVSAATSGDGPAPPRVAGSAAADSSWQPWDPQVVDARRREGHVVFVDFTADWCLSCKVNERVALAGDDFAALLRDHGIVAMRGDWTRADPRITKTLESFGRSGVPLYLVYPADAEREVVVLPQILTPGLVRDALLAAGR